MLWKLNSGFQKDYFQRLAEQNRPLKFLGVKTPEGFSAELNKLYIQPLLLNKTLETINQSMIYKPNIKENISIWDVLIKSTSDTDFKKIIILGVPGAGKTKLLEYVTLAYADGNQRLAHPKAPKLIPVLLSFRQIAKLVTTYPKPNLATVINKIIIRDSGAKLNPPAEWFQNNLTEGKCLVMLDGLDEIFNYNLRVQVTQWLEEQMFSYPETVFIITARPQGYINNQLKSVKTCLELQIFNPQQIEQYLSGWYKQSDLEPILKAITKHPDIAAMSANPLILTILAFFESQEKLPQNRAEFYEQIMDCLLYRREKAKMLTQNCLLQLPEKKRLLQTLSLALMESNQQEFTLEEAKNILSKHLEDLGEAVITTENFIEYIKNIPGLIIETKSAETYRFCHGSFLEYFAAGAIKETNQETILTANIENPTWEGLLRLYVTMSEVDELIMSAWEKKTVKSMTLAYDCCSQDNNLNVRLQGKLDEWLDYALESQDPHVATLAAQVQLSLRLNYALEVN